MVKKKTKKIGGRDWDFRKPILLAPLKEEHKLIRQAAAKEGVPMTVFLMKYGMKAALRVLAGKSD